MTPHFSNRTLKYLRHNFPWDRLISHQTDNPWPSYSQDLNPPDYFLRGYLKDRVCENNPQTREDIIRREIRWIPQEMLNGVVDNFNVRVADVLSTAAWYMERTYSKPLLILSGFHQKNSINFQYLLRKNLAGVLIFVKVIAKEK